MTIWLVLLGGYLLGSVPVSYLAGKLRGIDLREYGTGQAGAGNLWRMTAWKIGLPVGIYDFAKGMFMVWVAKAVGMDAGGQIAAGLAALIGHNWSVFLRFSGGRGIATALGIILILPLLGSVSPWEILAFFAVGLPVLGIVRSTPLPVLLAFVVLPLAAWVMHEPLTVTSGFAGILIVIVVKRLLPGQADVSAVSKPGLLFYRVLFDRDIRDKKAWMYRKPSGPGVAGRGGE